MDGFRRMLWVGRQHSADHIPVSALQLVTLRAVDTVLLGSCQALKRFFLALMRV